MTDITIEEYKLRNGEGFRATVHKEVTSNGTLTLHIHNPSDSGMQVVISRVRMSSPGPYTIRHPMNADYTTVTVDDSYNRYHGGGFDSSSAVIYQDSSYSNEEATFEEYIGVDDSQPGESSNAVGGYTSDPVGIVAEGGDFLFELENRSSSTAYDSSISIDFYESSNE